MYRVIVRFENLDQEYNIASYDIVDGGIIFRHPTSGKKLHLVNDDLKSVQISNLLTGEVMTYDPKTGTIT